MRITYDPSADAAYIYLQEDAVVATGEPCDGDIYIEDTAVILEYNAQKQLVGIEILGASRLLSAEALAGAEIL